MRTTFCLPSDATYNRIFAVYRIAMVSLCAKAFIPFPTHKHLPNIIIVWLFVTPAYWSSKCQSHNLCHHEESTHIIIIIVQSSLKAPDAASGHPHVRLSSSHHGSGVWLGSAGGHDEHRHPAGLHHGGDLRPHPQVRHGHDSDDVTHDTHHQVSGHQPGHVWVHPAGSGWPQWQWGGALPLQEWIRQCQVWGRQIKTDTIQIVTSK